MKIETLLHDATSAFRQKFQEICPESISAELTPETFSTLCRVLKEVFSACGTQTLKAYLESFEDDRDLIFHEGGRRRFKKVSAKEFLTPFGWVTVNRRLFQSDAGGECHCPLDEKWTMRNETLTPMVREAVDLASAHNTPEEVELLLEKCALFQPSRTAIQNATAAFGAYWEKRGEEILETVRRQEALPEAEALVVSLDGVNVLMREKGKKRGRKRGKPTDNPTEESKTSYQNAMVGSVSLYRSPKGKEEGPIRLQSRYVARMPEGGFGEFRKALEAEVSNTSCRALSTWRKVLLLDGSRALWNYAAACPTYAGFDQVVDFYHTSEYLAKAADAAYGEATYNSQGWYRKWKECLLTEPGAVHRILRAIGYLQRSRKLTGEKKKQLRSAQSFFRNNRARMDYAYFHNQGLPVGSGPVEAACKSIVKTRMCRSGMRWTPKGGTAILALRTIVKSNRWNECWYEYESLKRAA